MSHVPHHRALAAAGAALKRYAADETASSTAEYALMLLVLAGCAIVALHHIGQVSGRIMINVGNALEQHPPAA